MSLFQFQYGVERKATGPVVNAHVCARSYSLPALVIWLASWWKEKCWRSGGNVSGEIICFVLFIKYSASVCEQTITILPT